MKALSLGVVLTLLLITGTPAKAAILLFDLQGTGGVGMLNTSEPGSPAGGTGGESGPGTAGISYDTGSKILSINVEWGSLNGFTDMTGAINGSHIHVTPSNGGAGFTEIGGIAFTLARVDSTANNGSIATTVTLSAAQEADLLNGKYYINVHTVANSGGEARGFLVQVPEPSRATCALLGVSLLAFRRRR